MNKNFCNFPFMAVDRHQTFRPCCLNTTFNQCRFNNISDYWNSQELKDLRTQFINGIKDPGCSVCWKLEESGVKSLRLESLSRSVSTPYSIRQIKLITGKICNLSCMTCFSSVSSSYEYLWKNDINWIMPDSKKDDLVYDTEMDLWIRNNFTQLEYIEALGGEPLFSKSFLDLLEYLIKQGASEHITLFLITNITLPMPKILHVLKKFKKVVFAVSIDAVGTANNYIRWNSDFNRIQENINLIREFADCSVLPTVSALNIIRLPELYEYCDKQQLTINNLGIVAHWPQLLPSNLPQELHKLVDSKFRPLLEGSNESNKLIEFIQRWDRQRNINIVDYMPEWQAVNEIINI